MASRAMNTVTGTKDENPLRIPDSGSRDYLTHGWHHPAKPLQRKNPHEGKKKKKGRVRGYGRVAAGGGWWTVPGLRYT